MKKEDYGRFVCLPVCLIARLLACLLIYLLLLLLFVWFGLVWMFCLLFDLRVFLEFPVLGNILP